MKNHVLMIYVIGLKDFIDSVISLSRKHLPFSVYIFAGRGVKEKQHCSSNDAAKDTVNKGVTLTTTSLNTGFVPTIVHESPTTGNSATNRSGPTSAMIDLRADEELKDSIVVAMPKLVGGILAQSSSDSDNNTSDSANTSQLSTSEEIYYDSPEYREPPKSLLKWYGYLSDEYKDRFWGSKPGEIIILSSDSSDDRKGPSKASVLIFEGPSVQGLLDNYGYNDIEEYLSWNYFLSTDKENTYKDITDNDITDEDCIHKSNYAMSKVCNASFVCSQAFAGKHLQVCICKHLQLASICILHLHLAFASKHLQAVVCKQAFSGAKRSAFATEKANGQREGSRLSRTLAKLDSHSEALRVSEAL
ncbi:hypothetical protein Tco_1209794 [Tanacetum coccineum]